MCFCTVSVVDPRSERLIHSLFVHHIFIAVFVVVLQMRAAVDSPRINALIFNILRREVLSVPSESSTIPYKYADTTVYLIFLVPADPTRLPYLTIPSLSTARLRLVYGLHRKSEVRTLLSVSIYQAREKSPHSGKQLQKIQTKSQ